MSRSEPCIRDLKIIAEAGGSSSFLSELLLPHLLARAKKVGRLTVLRKKVFGRRYQAILVSPEEAVQVERLITFSAMEPRKDWRTARGAPAGLCYAASKG